MNEQLPTLPTGKDHRTIPGPKGLPFFGVLNARPDTLNFYRNNHAEFGELTRYVAFKKFDWYFVGHPDDIEQIMLGSPDVYYKGYAWERMRRVFGKGLFVSDGDLWKRQHKLILPGFHRSQHDQFATEMIEIIAETVESWRVRARTGQVFDMAEEMMRLTLMNVSRTMFGDDIRDYVDEMGRALEVILHWAHLRALSIESWRGEKKFEAALQTFFNLIDVLIAGRRAHHAKVGVTHNDMLDLLLSARHEDTGQPMDDAQMRDEMITIIGAGYETAAVGLAWCWHLLDQNPDWKNRVQIEIDEVFDKRLPTMDDLQNTPLLKMTLQEAMRLYPPIWGLSRQTQEEVVLRGYRLPPKAILVMFPYVTHRHPDFWENPDKFDPERFTPERSAGRPRFSYFPFGGGQRMCLGAAFAMMETQFIVAMIMQHFHVDVVPNHPVEPSLYPSLRLKYGLSVTLRER